MELENLPCEYLDIRLAKIATDVICDSNSRYIWQSREPGTWWLSHSKNISFHTITVWKNAGHWSISNGHGRILTKQPSAFTGSFCFQGYSESGLIVRLGAGVNVVPTIAITWVEFDEKD
jgi:hypothetical protein